MHKKVLFYSLLLKKLNIYIFSHVKMAAKYAKIDRVGNVDASFQQVPLVQNFWIFHNTVMKHQ